MESGKKEALQRATHQPMFVVCDLMTENPDSNKKALVAKMKTAVTEDVIRERLLHAQSLE